MAETCHCPKYLSTSVSPSSLDKNGPGGLTQVIADAIKKTCGFCKEHGETELIFSTNDNEESSVRFPVSLTNLRARSLSKFVAVLEVPGVAVLKRRGDNSIQQYYEQVMTGSLFDTWPVIIMTVLLMYAVGVIIWFLVRYFTFFSHLIGTLGCVYIVFSQQDIPSLFIKL